MEVVDTGGEDKKTVIHVESAKVNKVKGLAELVDKKGNRFGSFDNGHLQEIGGKPSKFEGKYWEISFRTTDNGYLRLSEIHGEKENPVNVLNTRLKTLTAKELSITQDSARHDAVRIVGKLIEKDEIPASDNDAIKKQVRIWTEFFQHHSRTGEWQR